MRKLFCRYTIWLIILSSLGLATNVYADAQFWTVAYIQQIYTNPAQSITFTFENDHLSLNTSRIYYYDYTSWDYRLALYGNWAVCGTSDGNSLIRDPYATFVDTGNGNGYIQWAPTTPRGYTTELHLGKKFVGNGAVTLPSYKFYAGGNGFVDEPVTGTVFVQNYTYYWIQHDTWQDISHTFTATCNYDPVPEPSSILALLCGIGSLSTAVVRRKAK